MKKRKLRSLIKSARKKARVNIQLTLITGLEQAAISLGQGPKFVKEIKKSSKRLAKKLSKELKIDPAGLLVESAPAPVAPVQKARATKPLASKSQSSGDVPKTAMAKPEQG